MTKDLKRSLWDSLAITLVFSILGLAVNAWVHPHPLKFIADEPYQTMVPCPVPGGNTTPIDPGDARLFSPDSFIIDARDNGDFAKWHFTKAMNVPFDYLDPTPDKVLEKVAEKAAASGAKRVVVYGDGDDPDTGEQLAKEISGRGIKNVFFVKGGAPSIEQAKPGGSR